MCEVFVCGRDVLVSNGVDELVLLPCYNSHMSLLNVAILRGGPSSEYDVSLRSGAKVLGELPQHVVPSDIFISKKGEWHAGGITKDPVRALSGIHVVFNAMHGHYGEDGTVQKLLAHIGVPYTGPEPLGAFLSMHKVLAKDRVSKYGVPVANGVRLDKETYSRNDLFEIKKRVGDEIVLKPARNGSSLGIHKTSSIDEMADIIEQVFAHDEVVLAEEFIDGIELSCGVLDDFDGETSCALFPVEIEHGNSSGIWSAENKYDNSKHTYHIPARVPRSVRRAVQELSIIAHNALMLRHYSRSDFIYHPTRGLFFLETNSLPGLTETSIYPLELQHAGISMKEFTDHVLKMAMKK